MTVVAATRLELRRTVASLRRHPLQVTAAAVLALLPVLMSVVGAYRVGQRIATEGVRLTVARNVAAIGWALAALGFIATAAEDRGGLTRPTLLAVAGPWTLFAGYLFGRIAVIGFLVAPAAVAITTALAIGANRPSIVATGTVAVLLGVGTALAVGTIVGIGMVTVADRVQAFREHRSELVLILCGSVFLFPGVTSVPSAFAVVERAPTRHYADLLFGAGASASAVVVGTVVTVAGAVVIGGQLLGAIGYHDARRAKDESDAGTRSARFVSNDRPGVAVAARIVTQTVRRPRRLFPVFTPLMLGGVLVWESLQRGRVVPLLPLVVLLFGIWAPGVVFVFETLNLDRSSAPTTLLAATPQTVVDGLVITTTTIAAPVVGALGAVTASLAGLPDTTVGVVLLSGIVWPPVATTFATAVAIVAADAGIGRRFAVGIYSVTLLAPLFLGVIAPPLVAPVVGDAAAVPASGAVIVVVGIVTGAVVRRLTTERIASASLE
jgi:hypothetical protein